MLAAISVDGPVNAQPLYASGVTMSDNKTHNVLYVVTGHNVAYAFDADTFTQLWKTVLGPPPLRQYIFGDPDAGVNSTPVIYTFGTTPAVLLTTYRTPNAATERNDFHLATVSVTNGQVVDDHTITSSKWTGSAGGIDNTGACDLSVELCGDVGAYHQRPALLVVNNVLYVGFGGSWEPAFNWAGIKPPVNSEHALTVGFGNGNQNFRYRGQLLAYTLVFGVPQFAGRWISVDPGVSGSRLGGGIWQGAVGPAADANGDVYVATGNAFSDPSINPPPSTDPNPLATLRARQDSDFSPAAGSYGNSVVRLHPVVSGPATVTFQVAQSFTPYRTYWQNIQDFDFGSAGPLLVPGTNQLVQGGKEGILYVLDRDAMGGASRALTPAEYWSYPTGTNGAPCPNVGTWPSASIPAPATQVLYQPNDPSRDGLSSTNELATSNFDIPRPPMDCWIAWPHVHGTPVFGTIPGAGSYLYVWPEKDYLKAYQATSTSPLQLASSPAINDNVAPSPAGMPGGMLTLVTDPGGGGGVLLAQVPVESIPFTVQSGTTNNQLYAAYGSLHAYSAVPDASGHLHELWNDSGTAWYRSTSFVPPTVGGNNRVYVAGGMDPGSATGMIVVYGANSGDKRTRYSTPSGGVTAFHQNAATNQITVAIVGTDGAVHIFWELNNDSWATPGQQAVATPTGVAPPGAPIVSVALQDGETFYTFFVDNNGAVEWLSVVNGQNWLYRGAITAPGFATPGAKLSAYAPQGSSLVDVFVVGSDGAAYALSKAPTDFSFLSTRISPTNVHTSGARLAAGSHAPGQVSVLSVNVSGELYETTAPANAQGSWGTPAPIPAGLGLAPSGDLTSTGDYYWATVDAYGHLVVFANTGSGWQTSYLSGPTSAPGGGVAMGYFAGVPMAFTVGTEGAIDIYQLQNGAWTPAINAHTQSFGTASPGAPLAVAFQSSDPGAEVLDVLVQAKTDVFVTWIAQNYYPGATQPYWARPSWVYH
jgi:hypothetical protein